MHDATELRKTVELAKEDLGVFAARWYARDVDVLLRENAELLANLTSTQERCSTLLDEARANRRLAAAPPAELHALAHVSHERRLQDQKFGKPEDESRKRIQDGTGGKEADMVLDILRHDFAKKLVADKVTWADILREEVAEVFVETDPKLLRQELVQVAAVAVLWIEMIDRRLGHVGLALPGWDCVGCGAFNGCAKDLLTTCRCCGAVR
jgi:hypothetical protein